MFLSQRATQAEYCDRPDLPLEEVADNYRQLARFNRMMLVADPFQRLLVRWLGRMNVAKLTLLDLGAGDGSLGSEIEAWARRYGWESTTSPCDNTPMTGTPAFLIIWRGSPFGGAAEQRLMRPGPPGLLSTKPSYTFARG